jgi:hypothetical protein
MIPPPDCAAREDDPCDDECSEYEPDWEDISWHLEQEERLKDWQNYTLEAERQLHDPRYIRYHTDRHLCDLSKEVKSLKRALWEEYNFNFDNDCFEVLLEDFETSITLSRDGHRLTLTRKDKQRMRKNRRKRARRLEILTKRGCSPRQVKGYEGESFYPPVVAAT